MFKIFKTIRSLSQSWLLPVVGIVLIIGCLFIALNLKTVLACTLFLGSVLVLLVVGYLYLQRAGKGNQSTDEIDKLRQEIVNLRSQAERQKPIFSIPEMVMKVTFAEFPFNHSDFLEIELERSPVKRSILNICGNYYQTRIYYRGLLNYSGILQSEFDLNQLYVRESGDELIAYVPMRDKVSSKDVEMKWLLHGRIEVETWEGSSQNADTFKKTKIEVTDFHVTQKEDEQYQQVKEKINNSPLLEEKNGELLAERRNLIVSYMLNQFGKKIRIETLSSEDNTDNLMLLSDYVDYRNQALVGNNQKLLQSED